MIAALFAAEWDTLSTLQHRALSAPISSSSLLQATEESPERQIALDAALEAIKAFVKTLNIPTAISLGTAMPKKSMCDAEKLTGLAASMTDEQREYARTVAECIADYPECTELLREHVRASLQMKEIPYQAAALLISHDPLESENYAEAQSIANAFLEATPETPKKSTNVAQAPSR